jgi:broad specificity phosphatase PhoE
MLTSMASELFLIRHGETEWSKNGRHTSTTDLPLTAPGTAASRALGGFLAPLHLDHVFSSPRQRARITAELALGERANMVEVTDDLAEWHYGDYEGLTSPQIRETTPEWDLWTQGCPGGEKPGDVEARLTRLFERIDSIEGTVACFAHSHILRAFGSLWVSGDVVLGSRLRLGTAAISVLGYEHGKQAIIRWNFDASPV